MGYNRREIYDGLKFLGIGFDDQDQIAVHDDGTFEITLNVERSFEMTPELHIYTDCNDKIIYDTIEKVRSSNLCEILEGN